MNPLISIIVPIYNVEKYLKKCLDSILEQTYENLEVILINDGSTDTSGEICDNYIHKFRNCKYIRKSNAGLGFARNSGLDEATGEYIVFVDSDDYIPCNSIETLFKNINNFKSDICKGGFTHVDNNGEVLSKKIYTYKDYDNRTIKSEFLPSLIGSTAAKSDSIEMSVWGTIYRASIIKQNNIRFPSERELISEDLIFNINFIKYATSAVIITDVVYHYRCNNNSLTTKYREERFDLCKKLYLEVTKMLTPYNYDKYVLYRLDKTFFIYLKMCFIQENPKISGKSKKDSLKSIKRICSDEIVKNIISKYPVSKLGWKQQIFLYLIKYNCIEILYFCCKYGVIK